MHVSNRNQLLAAGLILAGGVAGGSSIAMKGTDGPSAPGAALLGGGLTSLGVGAHRASKSIDTLHTVPMSQIGTMTRGMEIRARAMPIAAALTAAGLVVGAFTVKAPQAGSA